MFPNWKSQRKAFPLSCCLTNGNGRWVEGRRTGYWWQPCCMLAGVDGESQEVCLQHSDPLGRVVVTKMPIIRLPDGYMEHHVATKCLLEEKERLPGTVCVGVLITSLPERKRWSAWGQGALQMDLDRMNGLRSMEWASVKMSSSSCSLVTTTLWWRWVGNWIWWSCKYFPT